MRPRFCDVSSTGTFAVEWAGAGRSRIRLVNPCGTTRLEFWIRHPGGDWQPMPVDARIGLATPPATFTEFKNAAEDLVVP